MRLAFQSAVHRPPLTVSYHMVGPVLLFCLHWNTWTREEGLLLHSAMGARGCQGVRADWTASRTPAELVRTGRAPDLSMKKPTVIGGHTASTALAAQVRGSHGLFASIPGFPRRCSQMWPASQTRAQHMCPRERERVSSGSSLASFRRKLDAS